MRRILEILRHTQSPRKEVTCNLNVLKEANTHSSSKKVEFHKSVYYFFLQKKVFVVVILSLATRRRRRTSVLRDHTATSSLLSSPLIGYLFLIQLVGSESKNLGQPSAAFAWNQAEGTGEMAVGGHLLDATGKTNKPSNGMAK